MTSKSLYLSFSTLHCSFFFFYGELIPLTSLIKYALIGSIKLPLNVFELNNTPRGLIEDLQ